MLGYLHGHQTVVDSLLFHQLPVCPQLHDLTVTETANDVGISEGGEAVGDHDGGATYTDLRSERIHSCLLDWESSLWVPGHCA